MKAANLLLRFLLELAALVAVSYWGYHVAEGEAGRLALCITAPVLFGVLWALFAAHKAKFPPPQPWKALVGFLLLECGAVCLALGGQLELAAAFALLIATNTATLELSKR
jgi:hypothetical protein